MMWFGLFLYSFIIMGVIRGRVTLEVTIKTPAVFEYGRCKNE